mgnify:CR=1 FL=1
MKKKSAFVPMACDLIHEGHINILKEASKLGEVTVGLLTDEAISKYKPIPTFDFKRRTKIVESIKYVSKILKTTDWDYATALDKLKPDFVVHGDDWKSNNQKIVRSNVKSQIKKWNGVLVEIPYTQGISSTSVKETLKQNFKGNDLRNNVFNRLIKNKKLIRVIEVHNGLSALISSQAKYKNNEFDCLWLSSLTHSASKGKPDIEYIDDTTVTQTINDIFDVSLKPLIFDADSGGRIEHLKFTIKNLSRLGVSAIMLEDKIGNKVNSLEKTNNQKQDSIINFCSKIIESKKITKLKEIKIFARIESLTLNKPVSDAINRAKHYLNAGADGIMIHSKKINPKEVFEFCKRYNAIINKKPLIVVPSTYNKTHETELAKNGVNIVIYANQILRSAIPAMQKTAIQILKNGRSYESDKDMISIQNTLKIFD